MLLHKYTTTLGKDIILNGRIKVSDPYNFNDPFEHAVNVIDVKPSEIKKFTLKNKNELAFIYSSLVKQGLKQTWKQFRKQNFDPKFREEKAREIATRSSESLRHLFVPKEGEATEYFFVSCFCAQPDDLADEILMWAHYSEGQKGIRYWIDSDLLGSGDGYSLTKVDYQEETPKLYTRDFIAKQRTNIESALQQRLKTKSKVWKYENEHRWFVDKKHVFEEGKAYYTKINRNVVKKIDFGIKCDNSVKEEIRTRIKELNLDIELRQARQDDKVYKINYLKE